MRIFAALAPLLAAVAVGLAVGLAFPDVPAWARVPGTVVLAAIAINKAESVARRRL